MSIDLDSKRRAQGIISIFETNKAEGDYGAVALLPDGAGLSIGSHQATDRADTADAILQSYIDAGGRDADALAPFLPRFLSDASINLDPAAPPVEWVREFKSAFRKAADDPIMRRVQDEVFDRLYWMPMLAEAASAGAVLPLSLAVLYDTAIQSGVGGIRRMRALFPQKAPARGGDERAWATAYVVARRKWLASHPNPVVQRTVYRPDAFLALIQGGNWQLLPPFQVRGVTVS